MSAKTARKQRATARNQRRAQENAAKRGEGDTATVTRLPAEREKTGLEWLVFKRRISTRQALAGRSYGEDYRIAALHGSVPLRSCLNDTPGGSAAARSLPAVEYHLEALERLGAAQAALSYQSDMIAALAAICGRQLTPWQAVELTGGSARDVSKLEAVIVVALDLLDKHYRSAR